MGAAASAIKAAHHVTALKELYEAKIQEGVSDAELLECIKAMIESDMHCYRGGTRIEGKKGNPHHDEPTEEEMSQRNAHAKNDVEHEHHEPPHPHQVKPCDDGYVVSCGCDFPIHAPKLTTFDESIDMSGVYKAAKGKYHKRKDLFFREPTHVSSDGTSFLQGKLSFELGGENPGWRLSHILHWQNAFGEEITSDHLLYYNTHKRKDHAPPLHGWRLVNAAPEGPLPSFEPATP